jgi:hypothetical protein
MKFLGPGGREEDEGIEVIKSTSGCGEGSRIYLHFSRVGTEKVPLPLSALGRASLILVWPSSTWARFRGSGVPLSICRILKGGEDHLHPSKGGE